ncbi:MAG: sulfite exporter TauE/SafE family protein [Chitinophagales bacterium]|nr:sulfite exporter TauE/SafE family protein [Chitinophagales bacterium]
MEKYYLFYFLAFVAEVIGTLSGFGSSILFVPLASYFFDVKEVLGITGMFHVFSNLAKIFLFHKHLDKNILLKLGIPAIVFVIIGALLSKYIPTHYLEIFVCFTLCFIAILLLIYSDKGIEINNRNLVSSGIFSGFFAGIIGSGGAIRGLALTSLQLEKSILISTSAFIDLGVDISRTIVYLFNGYMNKESYLILPGLIVIAIIGSYIGKRLLVYLSQSNFRKLVLIIILSTTILQLYKLLFEAK